MCHRLRMSARKFKMHVNMSAFFYHMRHYYGPWYFLNSTCDIGLSNMRQGLKIIVKCDIAYS